MTDHGTSEKLPGFRDYIAYVLIVVVTPLVGMGWVLVFSGLRWLFNEMGMDESACTMWAAIAVVASVLCIAAIFTLKEFREKAGTAIHRAETQLVVKMGEEYKEELRSWANEEITKQNKAYRGECELWLKGQIEQTKRHYSEKYKEDVAAYKRKCDDDVAHILHESSQHYPWLAQMIADYEYTENQKIYRTLRNKKNPAIKAAEEVKKIAGEKRALVKANKELQYQLHYYESLFPWLEEFKLIDPVEAYCYASADDTSDNEDNYSKFKDYLSPEEYHNLPRVEKFQRALDRYKTRKKTSWQIGIEYERYVGFLLEKDGYKVTYNGAREGLEDMGRDLLAEKDKKVLVIQCKRWAQEKTIHEKHIFQLYGTMVLLASEKPRKQFVAVFITTAELSDVAKRCADYLDVKCIENLPIADYPMIKCNVANNGEKIYHLPFDQQYDRVAIQGKAGACYVATVQEAEDRGFRRAYRWVGDKVAQ